MTPVLGEIALLAISLAIIAILKPALLAKTALSKDTTRKYQKSNLDVC